MKRLREKLLVLAFIYMAALTLLPANQAIPVAGDDWKIPDVGMEFVWISDLDCWVGKYEVTNGEYRKFKPDHDSGSYESKSLNGDRQPVAFVTCEDASEYAKWLTGREQQAGRLPAGYRYRLPSGNEWTKFCLCGDNRLYPWGDQMPPKYGNYSGREAGGQWGRIAGYNDGFPVSCPVEQSGMNEWGLYGVGGNVWECTVKQGTDTLEGWRGASWGNNLPVSMQSLCLIANFAAFRYGGFRLILAR